MLKIPSCLCLVFALACVPATAGVVINGDFSSSVALQGYSSTGSVSEPPPGDFALFDESGVLMQTVTIPGGSSSLTFDFAFSTTATTPTGATLDDSFAAELTTSPDTDVLDLFVVDVSGVVPDPLDGLESFFPGVVPIDVDFDPSVSIAGFQSKTGGTDFFGRVSLDLPNTVLGESATITFRLLDNDFGFETVAAIDNFAVSSSNSTIPEPASLAVWIVMAGGCMSMRRKRAGVPPSSVPPCEGLGKA
ncbi:hypothetical protein NZK35_26375 [Stieleria sp. ICT_E10.1]|uniref:hypothetical protein n=1 Tax=Stieleria sedimenti TaxID=2976331 RepID=UPI00217FF789|nr:hypothetical protein [Stieleria sedimenti]MCS7470188.1 hypothetical protein [Stieleria sedimenti]